MKLSRRPPAWMRLAEEFPGRMTGAAAGPVADGHLLAREAWGFTKEQDWKGEGPRGDAAFAYLWRRFGPSPHGYDDHKELCCYYLGTPLDGCLLWVSPRGGSVGTGYLITRDLNDRAERPRTLHWRKVAAWAREHGRDPQAVFWQPKILARAEADVGRFPKWDDVRNWRTCRKVIRDINQALFDALRELLRPVAVRDLAINILGRCKTSCAEAPRSPLTGLGVPLEPMRALLRGEDTQDG
jgi:hypothetical protein